LSRKSKYFLVIALILAGIVAVFLTEPPPEFRFANATGDCSGRTVFMYNAIYRERTEADIVFFGSSKTLNGINDSLMTERGTRFLNLGYCRFGRNLDYFFIREYLKNHHPKKVVLELREMENDNAHPLTAFLMPLAGLAEGLRFLQPDILKDLFNKWLCNLKYCRARLFRISIQVPDLPGVFGYWPSRQLVSIETLEQKKRSDSLKKATEPARNVSLNRRSAYYFSQVSMLCQRKNIHLYLLYLPSFGNMQGVPPEYQELTTFAEMLSLPDSIIKNAQYFGDYNHFNRSGARAATFWIKNRLVVKE
jgi:hypothetical protein